MSQEILALQMHPMQKAVTGEELYKAVEQALVTATCQVSRQEASCISHAIELYAPRLHVLQRLVFSVLSVAFTMIVCVRHAYADFITASSTNTC